VYCRRPSTPSRHSSHFCHISSHLQPPPPPKQETKWEKFAKEKGIPLNKEKRSQKVFDEDSGEWKFRHGYNRANDVKEWPIMEVNPNDDPNADPWEKDREAKRTRVNKNTESRMRNEERAGNMSKGTTTRSLKSKEKTREAGRAGGGAKILPSGVPVDLRSARGGDEKLSAAQRGKTSITAALAATQRSTASLGKFDKTREGEPEKKKAVTSVKKRKLETSTDRKVVATEGERGMKVLKSVIDGGGVAKEKMRKKGQLAKGETAYDYDFDDGLGASSFRKKKGRAGAGKMKKMTKKRVK
jgi:regulator of ribosome biosynthesis